ncbi:TVG1219474 [Thermoplasma volcanium GSS1]|uniref:TVG1219474 protein n=1 Tax=Thermoplasma volcanium (strain ATCC 51530 / DSM 4299 / JCM 9571 / NBRC 15438 / GSS1) TaxID=273116 RepID=Q979H2_THEVO|nr:hypothetical protein [Thermoplasma volcanium]BAB60331.1 TVG1219474 [Thermoplasma volcanium GSS1]
MLSRNATVAISVIVLIVFAGVAYEVIHNSSSTSETLKISGNIKVKPDLKPSLTKTVNNTTYPIYLVSQNTNYIYLNFTLNSTSNTVYVYDISPLNSSTYSWTNLTFFNGTGNYVELANVSSVPINYSLKLYINKEAIPMMKPDIPYDVVILFISDQGVSTYLPLIFMTLQ